MPELTETLASYVPWLILRRPASAPTPIKLIKIGARLVHHARRLVFQLAEVAVTREVFRQVRKRIGGLHPVPGRAGVCQAACAIRDRKRVLVRVFANCALTDT